MLKRTAADDNILCPLPLKPFPAAGLSAPELVGRMLSFVSWPLIAQAVYTHYLYLKATELITYKISV